MVDEADEGCGSAGAAGRGLNFERGRMRAEPFVNSGRRLSKRVCPSTSSEPSIAAGFDQRRDGYGVVANRLEGEGNVPAACPAERRVTRP